MLTRRSLMLAGLTVPAAVIGARAALALTPQQEVLDKSRISFDKLITSVEFGELPGYMKRFTVAFYTQSLVPHAMPQDNLLSILQSVFRDNVSALHAALTLVAMLVVALGVATRAVERREYVLEQ